MAAQSERDVFSRRKRARMQLEFLVCSDPCVAAPVIRGGSEREER
jgi:hypothetical protein